jgi:predicted ATPase
MISEITIEGFKSFGSPSKPICLGPMNFIVGANASGKTNFVSALRFLQLSLLNGVDRSVNDSFGGSVETLNRRLRDGKRPEICRFKVVLKNLQEKVEDTKLVAARYEVKIDLALKPENPTIVEEKLSADVELADGRSAEYQLHRDQNSVRIVDPTSKISTRTEVVHPQERARLAVTSGFIGAPALLFRELAQNWSFFAIDTERARKSAHESASFGTKGENLSAALHDIERKKGAGAMAQILNGMRSAIPRIKAINSVRSDNEGNWTFEIVENKIKELAPGSVSDGTIRLLAILVALHWSCESSSLLVIEELETNLHPHLFQQLVALLRVAAAEKQVIVTTHSPVFLDFLEPDELLLCERDEATTFTTMVPASNKDIMDDFRHKYSLGDLWIQGALGGIPE